MLQYQPHPHPEAAKQGLIVCTIEGCMIGGLGKTQDEALKNFILSINRLEAGRQLAVQAIQVAQGERPMPGYTVNEAAPVKEEPLIIQSGVTPDQLERMKAAQQRG